MEETRDELLSIADKLLDETPSETEVTALKARRIALIALRTELEKANAGQPNLHSGHHQNLMPQPQPAMHTQVKALLAMPQR